MLQLLNGKELFKDFKKDLLWAQKLVQSNGDYMLAPDDRNRGIFLRKTGTRTTVPPAHTHTVL
jgi:hypothetical protein